MSAAANAAPDRRLAMALRLADATPAGVRTALDTTAVVVVVDPADGPAAVLAAAALASMSARVVGHVLVGPVALPQPNPWRARSLRGVVAASRTPDAPVADLGRRITVRIGARGDSADFYVGGDDWTAVVSRRRQVPVGRCVVGGAGLHAATALAFGEVLKEILVPLGMRAVPIESELVWNLVDGQLAPAPPVHLHPSRPRRPPPQVALLGAGSVGSSAAALLAATGIRGAVDVVDPDRFDPVRNAYRCPAVPAGERGGKAAWAARVLADGGWSTRSHTRSIGDWAKMRPDAGYRGIAVVSVDNVDGRRDASDLLAAMSVSAGVSGASLHVQRHQATDELACPYCDLVDARRWSDQAVVYARLGLTVSRLQTLLEGMPLTAEDVATAVWTGAIDPTAVSDLPGRRLVDLLQRHYASVAVPPRNGEDVAGALGQRVSAPHVSWLAGTLLSVEVVKAALGLPGLDRRVELDLTGVPLGGWRRPPRDPSGRCPCTRPERRELARSLYGR